MRVALAEAYSSTSGLAHSDSVRVWQWICVLDGIWGSEPTRSKLRKG